MKRIFILIIIAAALVAGSLNAQTKAKPNLSDFKTLEAYVEALVDWKLDQRQPALRKPDQTLPTATEIFNLRTQCKAMAKEEWLTTASAFPKDSVMHWAYYVPRTNRCYLSLNHSTTSGPIAGPGTTYETTWSLEDVQTGETLAWARQSSGGREDKFGHIGGQDLTKLSREDAFNRALDYMADLTREK